MTKTCPLTRRGAILAELAAVALAALRYLLGRLFLVLCSERFLVPIFWAVPPRLLFLLLFLRTLCSIVLAYVILKKKESACSERLAVDIAFLVMNGDVVIGVFVVVSFLVSPPNEFGVNQESHSLAAALLRILPKFKAPGTCVFYSSPLSFLSFPLLFFLSFFWLFILYLHRSLVVALDRICSPWKPVFMLPRENCLKEKPLSVGRTAYLQPDT